MHSREDSARSSPTSPCRCRPAPAAACNRSCISAPPAPSPSERHLPSSAVLPQSSTGRYSALILPASMREKSSSVLTSLSRRNPLRCTVSICCSSRRDRGSRSLRISSSGPSISVSGVRNSWLILLKKIVFARRVPPAPPPCAAPAHTPRRWQCSPTPALPPASGTRCNCHPAPGTDSTRLPPLPAVPSLPKPAAATPLPYAEIDPMPRWQSRKKIPQLMHQLYLVAPHRLSIGHTCFPPSSIVCGAHLCRLGSRTTPPVP